MNLYHLLTLIFAISQVVCEKELCDGGEFTITDECHYCSDDELKEYDQCKQTGYVEILKCKSSKPSKVVKSCNGRVAYEIRAFWRFEAAMIVTSLVSGIAVMLRMRRLDRENTERIQRQISAL